MSTERPTPDTVITDPNQSFPIGEIADCVEEIKAREAIGTAQTLTCANCTEVSSNPGQFLRDGRWVCTEACRRELCHKQSMDDLAASGGIVDAP